MKPILGSFFVCAAILVIAGCKKSPPPEKPPLTVKVTPVVQKDVTEENQWVGLLDGNQNAAIQAQVTGYLLTQNYSEGSMVKKGDVLFTIDPRPFEAALAQAQATYATAIAKAQLQQINLQKQEQLYKTQVISELEYQTAYQNTQAAIANVAATQAAVQSAQVNLDYCTIKAPFDAVAGLAMAQVGDLVGPGGIVSNLTTLSQIDPMKFNFFITESQYLNASELLQSIQALPLEQRKNRLSLQLADGNAYPELGKFFFFNRQVNSSTGAIQITGLFPNPKGLLRPGLFAMVTAPVRELKDALLVPQKSTVELQGSYFVSVVDQENIVKTVPVTLGPVQGPLQVVTGPLKAGQMVIVEGVEKVRPGMKVNALPLAPEKKNPSPSPKTAEQPTTPETK